MHAVFSPNVTGWLVLFCPHCYDSLAASGALCVCVCVRAGGRACVRVRARAFTYLVSTATQWEGGIRVPTFISGGFLPEQVRGNTYSGLVTGWVRCLRRQHQ
eukprot:COSAG02_NODE_981_length_15488_cov_27.585093_10_plen_102_part_00